MKTCCGFTVQSKQQLSRVWLDCPSFRCHTKPFKWSYLVLLPEKLKSMSAVPASAPCCTARTQTGVFSYARADATVNVRGVSLTDNVVARGSVVFVVASTLRTYQVRYHFSTIFREVIRRKGNSFLSCRGEKLKVRSSFTKVSCGFCFRLGDTLDQRTWIAWQDVVSTHLKSAWK